LNILMLCCLIFAVGFPLSLFSVAFGTYFWLKGTVFSWFWRGVKAIFLSTLYKFLFTLTYPFQERRIRVSTTCIWLLNFFSYVGIVSI
jgi:hypothetical protein